VIYYRNWYYNTLRKRIVQYPDPVYFSGKSKMKSTYISIVFTSVVLGFSLLALTCTPVALFSSAPSAPPTSDVQLVEAIENVFVDIAHRSKPAIVTITAKNVTRGSEKKPDQHGSGFIFRKEGHIVTNNHVINGAGRIFVRIFDKREFIAEVVGGDAGTDIAVLKIETGKELPTLPFADSDRVKVGQFAIAIGNPFQLDYTVTTGIVSAKGRSLLPDDKLIRYQDFIQTNAWINKGNSGGPLLNIHGEVMGMNAMIRNPDGVPVTAPVRAGAGFAIPINQVKKISEQLVTHGRVTRGWLGIGLDRAPKGVRVTRVFPSSPAKLGGIERRDVIVEYNGQKIQDGQQLKFLIADSAGEKIEITVIRRGKPKTLNVMIGQMAPERMGIQTKPQPSKPSQEQPREEKK
jgi:S1-C subfamily serine protease